MSSLLGLTQCPYDDHNYPSCIDQFVSGIPDPMVDPTDPKPEVEIEESFDIMIDMNSLSNTHTVGDLARVVTGLLEDQA